MKGDLHNVSDRFGLSSRAEWSALDRKRKGAGGPTLEAGAQRGPAANAIQRPAVALSEPTARRPRTSPRTTYATQGCEADEGAVRVGHWD